MAETPRRAKIVCTLGPASRSEPVLRRLIRAGMDVARLNFSHGDPADHARTMESVRRLASEEGRTVGILQDLQGPKLRVGRVPGEPLRLRKGASFTLTTRAGVATDAAISITYKKLPHDVKKGDLILLDDGRIQLAVRELTGDEVRCRVIEGGPLTSFKGINLPGRALSTPALTPKDRRDLEWGIDHGVDFVALSFVREAKDLDAVTRVMHRRRVRIPVIAKLEKPQAVENLAAILERADGIMVARGDLGVELPPERVPVLQKRMIRLARQAGKPVITATQMLESMITNSRPTRAEASDVANAVFDGTDAVMLSAETAVGKYPVEAVKMMARVILAAERSSSFVFGAPAEFSGAPAVFGGDVSGRGSVADTVRGRRARFDAASGRGSVPDAIADSACLAARELGARVIAVFTQSGGTARVVSKYRPSTPIHAFTPIPGVERRLALVWGVNPQGVEELPTSDEMVEVVVARLREQRLVSTGDLIVITAGTPVQQAGTTNFMKVHRVEKGGA
jgi:pyruvate kinase